MLASRAVELIQVGRGRLSRDILYLPGVAILALIAAVASLLSAYLLWPPILLALLGGILFSSVAQRSEMVRGIEFAVRPVLRFGVALLGAQISLHQLALLGGPVLSVALLSVAVTLLVGFHVGRRFGLSADIAFMLAAAVSICGASAALAAAAVFARREQIEQNCAACVAAVTVIGTIAMILYPQLSILAGLDQRAAGVFLGASLHEVAQAIGSGFALSNEAGEAATTVKLVRVACLGPVIIFASWQLGRGEAGGARPPIVPPFLSAFALLALVSSLVALPESLVSTSGQVSRFCLLLAIAGLGAKISLKQLAAFGWKPMIVLVFQSLLIASVALLGAMLVSPAQR